MEQQRRHDDRNAPHPGPEDEVPRRRFAFWERPVQGFDQVVVLASVVVFRHLCHTFGWDAIDGVPCWGVLSGVPRYLTRPKRLS